MRAYTETLPLRRTTVWGAFRDAKIIPHRYGRCSGSLLPYDQSRKVWVWADHACPANSIESVTVGGQEVAFLQRVASDVTDHPVTFIDLATPVDEGAPAPIATGLGKMHARTGAPIHNPADVIHDLHQVAGNTFPESAIDRFRTECEALSIVVAGTVDSDLQLQEWIDQVCESIGAQWSPGMDGFARIFPGGALEPFASATITAENPIEPETLLQNVYNAAVVNYGHVDGQAKQSIELDAPESVAEYGRRQLEVDARWLVDGRVAHGLARRLLRHRARPNRNITVSGMKPVSTKRLLAPGHTVDLQHPRIPTAGHCMLLSAQTDPISGECAGSISVPDGAVPRVRLVRQSAAFEPEQYAGVEIEAQGDQRVLTVTDENGAPLANARVTLDGEWIRQTDAGGRVNFPADLLTPGNHTLLVEAEGRQSFTCTIVT